MSEFNQEPEVISVPPPASTGSGLADNVAGALAYITIVPAIVFLVLEPYNKNPFIRFHAFQNIALCVCLVVVSIFMVIPIIGWILGPLLMLVLLVAWVLCLINAFQGKRFKLPILGPFVENLAK
jgi:uncharacterized membrane protein